MYNIYLTSESESKLKTLYSNIKNFFILDVQAFVKSLHIDLNKPSSIYLANDEIQKLILSQAKLKRFKGVIYINKNLNTDIVRSFRECFQKKYKVSFVLIDNGQFPKHTDILDAFDEVVFYERFRRNKIIECSGFECVDDQIEDIIMEENEDF